MRRCFSRRAPEVGSPFASSSDGEKQRFFEFSLDASNIGVIVRLERQTHFESTVDWYLITKKNLLLFDCAGAAVTCVVTGLILTTVVQTGLPTGLLWALAATAALFACFDLYAYFHASDACWPLATIGLLNLTYCLTAIMFCVAFASTVTMLGVIYFTVESMIVIPLAALELTVARHCCRVKRNDNQL